MRIIDSEVTPTQHSDRTLLFFSAGKPVGHFAGVLAGRGLPDVLGTPQPLCDSIQVVPLAGATAGDVLSTLASEGEAEQWAPDPAYHDGTFQFASKPVGHGLSFAEVTVTDPPAAEWKPLPAHLRRPVIALLDTGVGDHDWLRVPDGPDQFLIDAEQVPGHRWCPDGTMPAVGAITAHPGPGAPVKSGHGTFIAGLIRQAAPSAQVLSVRVLNSEGISNESTVCGALQWLHNHIERGNHVDVVCMAFGRIPEGADDPLGGPMSCLLGKLAGRGVQLVASAGNDHQDTKVYPAAFDMVTAVGAGFGGYHAEFSNFGEWVGRYRDGVDQLSILPGNRWARWTGTSFAAANFAADLARPHVRP